VEKDELYFQTIAVSDNTIKINYPENNTFKKAQRQMKYKNNYLFTGSNKHKITAKSSKFQTLPLHFSVMSPGTDIPTGPGLWTILGVEQH
jgi:hypothetical protein